LNGGALNGIALPLARDETTQHGTIRYVPYYIIALGVVVNSSQAGYEWLRRLPGRSPTTDASALRLLDLLDHSRTGFPADHHLDLLLEEGA
jgi:hypothetical protein